MGRRIWWKKKNRNIVSLCEKKLIDEHEHTHTHIHTHVYKLRIHIFYNVGGIKNEEWRRRRKFKVN